MTPEQLGKIPRLDARQVIGRYTTCNPVEDTMMLIRVEQIMNIEWWRGYHAGLAMARNDSSRPFNSTEKP